MIFFIGYVKLGQWDMKPLPYPYLPNCSPFTVLKLARALLETWEFSK